MNKSQRNKENLALRKFALLQRAFYKKVSVQFAYIDMTKDHFAAYILEELVYWTLPTRNGQSGLRVWKDGYLWLAVSRTEWWERKRLTPRQVDYAIGKLLKLNLVFKEVHRFNGHGTIHIRLNIPEFFKQYGKVVEGKVEDVEDLADLVQMVEVDETWTEDEQVVQNNQMVRSELPNGETNNILDLQPRQYIPTASEEIVEQDQKANDNDGKDDKVPPPPEWGIGWAIGHGGPIDPAVAAADLQRQMKDKASQIATGVPNAELAVALVMAFQQARGMVIPDHKISHARKVIKNLIASDVQPAHVTQATTHLLSQEKTRIGVTGIHSIENLAISYATPVPTNYGSTPNVRVL